MPALLLALTGGILLAGCFTRLPPLYYLAGLIPLVAAAMWSSNIWLKRLLAGLCGVAWGVVYGHFALANILPDDLVQQDVFVEGRIAGIPQSDSRRQRVVLAVEQARNADGKNLTAKFPARIQLSWYQQEQLLVAGERWQLQVRLKQPRAFINPGGFDYEVWLLRRGIGAVGYVRKGEFNRWLAPPSSLDISHWRFALQQWVLSTIDTPYRGVLLALLIGDRSLIEPAQWEVLQQTGTNHLIAISGLHVGFVALLGLLLGGGFGRLLNVYVHRFSPVWLACAGASSFAFFYSALAGFSLPTQRALIMVLVAQYAYVMRRSFRPRDGLLVAFVLVLLRDPLAAYDPGFWLSFGAVGVLLLAFVGRIPTSRRRLPGASLIYSQWVIFIGLLLPLALLVNTTSLLAPLANLLAIPLVTFIVVPAVLIAAASRSLLPNASEFLLSVADKGLEGLFWFLQALLTLADGRLNPVLVFNSRALWLAAAGFALILLPRAIPGRWLGYPALLIALLVPIKSRPALQVTVMDVGQGLAVVVQTQGRTLVYDAGPAFGDSFDAGAGILLPYLRAEGVGHIDTLVISHNDNDHAGGVGGLLDNIAVDSVLWGETPPARLWALPEKNASCHEAAPWQWDGVNFQFLTWPISAGAKSNDRSCVLLVEYAGQTLLLPGDIGTAIEQRLLNAGQVPAGIDLLLAAHHGSRSSSAAAFVEFIQAKQVIYSAGYRNSHGHPHPIVVERFNTAGSRAFNTANSGALEFIWRRDQPLEIVEYRVKQRRYWHQ